MRFEIRPPNLVVFHDSKPGEHATLFAADGSRLPFVSEDSKFSDARREYAWAFQGRPQVGDRIVFATADREVAGIVQAGGVVALEVPVMGAVERGEEDDKPLDLGVLPSVAELLSPPYPRSRPRPVPMARGSHRPTKRDPGDHA